MNNLQKIFKHTMMFSACISAMYATAQSDEGQPDNTQSKKLEEIIVTGVFGSSELRKAAVSVTSIDEEELDKKVAFSAADMLKDVPGVFVNSALGEIRNVVYSRGLSANSTDGNNGYFYVSAQEDGLPVLNGIMTNYGPDYFLRPDIMTRKVEALRGGTAGITGPNAPGGIFNYLSKTGKSNPGTEISTRVGYEGDETNNRQYRADFYHGGKIIDNLYYAVGGFYRESDGPRNPGYEANRGGQFRANLLYEYDQGSVQFNFKRLNDHNIWDEFVPSQGIDDPSPLGQFKTNSPVQPSRTPFAFRKVTKNTPVGAQPTETDVWDPRDGIHNTQTAYTINWNHELGNGWSFKNDLKYSESEAEWDTGAAIFAFSSTVGGIFDPNQGPSPLAAGEWTEDGFVPFEGTIAFRDLDTGQVLQELDSTIVDGTAQYTVTNSSSNPGLPGSTPELPNAVLWQTAFSVNPSSDEIINQLVFTKAMDEMTFNIGGYYAFSDMYWISNEGGNGLASFTPEREMLGVTMERRSDGEDLQLTNGQGFAGLNRIGIFNNFQSQVEVEQVSLFASHEWDLTDQLTTSWGVRYETLSYEGQNQGVVTGTDPNGGLDGDELTIFDNDFQVLGTPVRADEDLDYFSFTGALSYDWNAQNVSHVRYSRSKKAPSAAAFVDPVTSVDITQAFIEQTIDQVELSHNFYLDRMTFTATAFYTNMDDIIGTGAPTQFRDVDGSTYVPPAVKTAQETLGIELSGNVDVTNNFNINLSATFQDSEASDNGVWVENDPGRADDEFIPLPDGDSENTPNIQSAVTGTYEFGSRFETFLTWRFMGERPANAANGFDLASFHTLDAGAQFYASESLTLRLNVNNVLDENGVMSWQGVGNFNALNRNSFQTTPENELWSVVTQQPRAVFVSASYRF